jgi:hypothetical protein
MANLLLDKMIEEVNKEEFNILLEIKQLKRRLGFAEHPTEVKDLKAERDRLRRLVRFCYE